MSHKFNPEKAEKLLSRDRYNELKPDVLLHKLGVRPGSTLLDLGCGNGFFTFPAAMGMGEEGMVIAADVSVEMLQLLDRRLPPDNVQILQVEEVKLDVEENSVDAVVGIAIYHEFKAPLENLHEISRVLKPGGKVLFLDWDPRSQQESGPQHHHRITVEQARNDLEQSGYRVHLEESYTEKMWLLIASKAD